MRARWLTAQGSFVGVRLMAIAAVVLLLLVPPLHAETLVFHASQSGHQTLDEGEGGGNPFASALIELLARPSLTLPQLPAALRDLTAKKSGNFQSADVPASRSLDAFRLVPPAAGQRRVALVLVVSDYVRSGGAQSLPGARRDAARVASALQATGFDAELAVDLDLKAMRNKLAEFAGRSRDADAAVIYTTGHGVETGGTVYLLPGDYPIAAQATALGQQALPLPEIARAPAAKTVNLVFYGGCRDNPFAR